MAKEIMKCPFSDKVCEECAVYRGRHYFLCYVDKYRGYIDNQKRDRIKKALGTTTKPEFDIPLVIPESAIDPFGNNNVKHPLIN